ncbi:MAG: DUF2520 domain-containing protein [Phycisphaerae bacterium]|nr:DUF2520 domain-containing protein [Phycisphaerae bacterium]
MTQERESISIIGAGVVGTALSCLAHRAGYPVAAISSRRLESSRQACRMLGRDVAVADPAEAARKGRMVLITTSDDAIASVCESLAEAGAFQQGAIVAHCCGGLSSDVLAPARERCEAHVASIHPMQTFPTAASAMSNFAGTWCFCEGDPAAVEALRRLFTAIGGRVEEISTGNKTLYHAAAVMACNYLVVLLEAAGELAKQSGIDRTVAMAAMRPLVNATIENVNRFGPAEALTGPIARGDIETVRRHLTAVAEVSNELAALYRLMGRRAVAIAEVKGTLSRDAAARLHELLQ